MFPFLLASLRVVTGGEALALVVILNALFLTGAAWLTALLAAERADWRAGLAALVIAGASPYACISPRRS